MTKRPLSAILLTLASLAGCGGPSISQPGPTSPHGGVMIELPENRGLVEILKQPAPGKAGRSQVVVYFLDRDRNPLTPAPTAATIKGQATGNKPVALAPLGGADASKTGGFASEPIADRGEIDGELTATIDGRPVTVPILVR